MKLWIDDIRDAPDDSWVEARKVQPAIDLLAKFDFEEISIDHDIENRPSDETFKPVVHYIGARWWTTIGMVQSELPEDVGLMRPLKGPKITIHSDNPVGAKEMIAILKDYGLTAKWVPYSTYGGKT